MRSSTNLKFSVVLGIIASTWSFGISPAHAQTAGQPHASLVAQPNTEAQPTTAPTEPRGSELGRPLWPYFAIGTIVVASVTTGVVLQVLATSERSQARDACGGAVGNTCIPQTEAQSRDFAWHMENSRRDLAFSYGAFAVGAAGLVGGTLLFVLQPAQPGASSAHAWVSPSFQPGLATIRLGSSF